MTVRIRGIVQGKHIELERELRIPSGSVVKLPIETPSLTLEEKRERVDQLCGVWADDPSIESVFTEIQQQRVLSTPREVDFEATS